MKVVHKFVRELQAECRGKEPEETLAVMAQELGGLPAVRRLARGFEDRKLYKERPVVLLCKSPTIYLLGWREGEGTGIHDHGAAQVGIYVVQGRVVEDLYGTTQGSYPDLRVAMNFTRVLKQGDLVTCSKNYIHRVRNIFPELGVTLHVYGPKLSYMSSWELNQDQTLLKFKEYWSAAADKEKVQ
jgi:hypothetical protein